MPTPRRTLAVSVITIALAGVAVLAQSNRIDVITPIAPELAAYGSYPVGVRTLSVVDHDRPDIQHTKEGGPAPAVS